MIVPGGGIVLDGKSWISCRPSFFLPVRVLSRLFRRLFLEKLVAAHQGGELQFFGSHAPLTDPKAFAAYLAPLRKSEWVVYSKRPFGGPREVLRYLARYTHRVSKQPVDRTRWRGRQEGKRLRRPPMAAELEQRIPCGRTSQGAPGGAQDC